MFQYVAAIETVPGGAPPEAHIRGWAEERSYRSLIITYSTDRSDGLASEADPHPNLRLTVAVDGDAYSQLNLQRPPKRSAAITAVADSDAQTCLMGMSILHKMGLRREHLTPVSKRILAANDEEVRVLGAIFVKVSGTGTRGQHMETSVMVYVTESTKRFYVSKSALVQLGVLGSHFPRIGAAVAATASSETGEKSVHKLAPCGCPRRDAPPGRPTSLSVQSSPANTDHMKTWLLKRYAASTFNMCPHQPLPAMAGPPMLSVSTRPWNRP